MQKLLQLIIFTCAPLLSTAQTQVFTIIKQKTFTQIHSKSDTITFSDYKKIGRQTSERTVSVNGVDYKFIIKDTRHVKLKEIVDPSGNKIASEFLNGDNQSNVVLADGRQLTWQRHRKAGWDYYLAGEVAVKVSITRRIKQLSSSFKEWIPRSAQRSCPLSQWSIGSKILLVSIRNEVLELCLA